MEFLTSITGILLIILGFGFLIFVHELGHFLAAKWAGIRAEAFAVGMGPIMFAWRKGAGFAAGSTDPKVIARTGKRAAELTDEELQRYGISETEYSLRWLPIGGFVKMLGQEDLHPTASSDDPRSYNRCPIGKRMVVVSAGVIMNVLLALVLFVIAFMVGVRFEAPVIGAIVPTLPASAAMPDNAGELGVERPGLQPGDVVVEIDGKPARTFADLQIASAMAKPGEPLFLTVERRGHEQPLHFLITPEEDPLSGLLSIGVVPASSTQLVTPGDVTPEAEQLLEQVGLAAEGIEFGMQLLSVEGQAVETYEQFQRIAGRQKDDRVGTSWQRVNEEGELVGAPIEAEIALVPQYQDLPYPHSETLAREQGLFGLVPLTKIVGFEEGSPSGEVLQVDDAILRAAGVLGPRIEDVKREVAARKKGEIELLVLRDGEKLEFNVPVSRQGRVGIELAYAWELPMLARSMTRIDAPAHDDADALRTPAASLNVPPLSTLVAAGGTPIEDWPALRAALRQATASAEERAEGAQVPITIAHPTPGSLQEELQLELSAEQVAELHELGWQAQAPAWLFEPVYTRLSANGNPFTAAAMGFKETYKLIVMTYLTIDRLVRGSVGVEQLRGPVGIVDLGSKVLPRGFMYFLFFLGMISVNLAVINFLPLPIVDGGLFLFLIYEKIRGRPPSPQFQNVATMVGLFLIGTVFVVTFYNDIVRLFS